MEFNISGTLMGLFGEFPKINKVAIIIFWAHWPKHH